MSAQPPYQRDGKAPGVVDPKAGGLDVLSQNAGENVRKVHSRELAANVVTALFRLVKLSTLHSLDNQAMVRQVDETVQLVGEYGQRTDHNVSILFAHGSVFVGGQLLRANRGIYEGALELGEILKKVGAAELGIMRDARASDFLSFASALSDALRTAKPQPVKRPSPRILLRSLSASALLRENIVSERVDPNIQVARTYASAVVIMRRFFEDLRRGKYELPQRVKRVAQRLVDLSTGETPAFLGVTAARNANHDEAGRAVNTAILSLAMTRQITPDMVQLSRVAMAALLFDCARARIAGAVGSSAGAVIPQLSEQQELEAPAGTAVVLTALGRVNEPSVMRTVIAYEAHWEKRKARLGQPYRGLRQPSLQARIVTTARAFNDLLTPAPGVTPPTADEAIAKLQQEATEPADRTVIRLLIGALGIFPTGTVVQLTTGEVALVVQAPSNPSLYSQPRVQIVVDEAGGQLPRPLDVDLAAKRRPGEPLRQIKQVLSTADDPSSAGLRSWAAGFAASGPSMVANNPTGYLRPAGGSTFPPAMPQSQPAQPSSQPQYQTPARFHSGFPQTFPNTAQSPGAPPPGAVTAAPGVSVPVAQAPYAPAPTQAPPKPYASVPPPPSSAFTPSPQARAAPFAAGSPGAPSPAALRAPLAPDVRSIASPEEITEDGRGVRTVSRDEEERLAEEARAIAEEQSAPPADAAPPDRPTTAPTAEGALQKTPFVHLLIYMLDQGLTGTTIFQAPGGVSHAIYFHQGAPAKVRTGAMIAPLDRVLLEQGFLDEATLAGTLMEVSKRRVLHGRHLVMKGLLDRETVLSALRLQVLRKVMHLFELEPATRYAYYEGQNLLASYGGPELTPCEPLAAIMAGIRLRASDPLVDATLLRIAGRPLALHLDADMRRFHLQRDERSLVDLMRTRRMTLAELVDAGVAQERIVRLTIYALAITRHLDLGQGGKPPVGSGRPLANDVLMQPEPQGVAAARARAEAQPQTQPQAQQRPRADAEPPPSVRTPLEAFRPTTKLTRVAPPQEQAPAPPQASAPADDESAAKGEAGRPTTKLPRPPGAAQGDSVMPPGPAPQQPIAVPPTAPRAPVAPPARTQTSPPSPARTQTSPPSSAPQRAAVPPPPPSQRGAPATPTPPAAAAGAARPDPAARRAEIERRAKEIDGEDFFQMLGIARDTPSDQMRGAYFGLAKAWHPDRLPAELADLKPQVARVFARLSEAYQTLNDAAKRADYMNLLQQGGGSADDQEKIARVVDAALEFQKAEILLKKNDLAGAEALARRAVQADPEQPEYLTLLVWIQAQRRGDPPGLAEGASSPHFDDLIKTLDAILAKEANYERAIYYRGVLQRRAGRSDKAIRDFRTAAELNPKNLDAVREVRLHEMRSKRGPAAPQPARKDPPPEGGGGLFGKFFKR